MLCNIIRGASHSTRGVMIISGVSVAFHNDILIPNNPER
jgi:hypothetical protein